MAISIRTVLIFLVLVGGIAGFFVWRSMEPDDACRRMVDSACEDVRSRGCNELRKKVGEVEITKVLEALCTEANGDEVFMAALRRARNSGESVTRALPFDVEAWEAERLRQQQSCSLLAEELKAEVPEEVFAALSSHSDTSACFAALGDRRARSDLRAEIALPLVDKAFEGDDPCEELSRRVEFIRGEKRQIGSSGFVEAQRCRATLQGEPLKAFLAANLSYDALAEVTLDPATLPWVGAALKQMPKRIQEACARQPAEGDDVNPSVGNELRRRCDLWPKLLEGGAGLNMIVVEEVRWIAPELASMPPDALGDVPWIEGKKPKPGRGRLAGGCAGLGVELCTGISEAQCTRARNALTGLEEEFCTRLKPRTSELRELLKVAGHEVKSGKPKFKLPAGGKPLMGAVKAPSDGSVTYRYHYKSSSVEKTVSSLNKAIKKARAKMEPIAAGGGRSVGSSRASGELTLDVQPAGKGSVLTVIEKPVKKK